MAAFGSATPARFGNTPSVPTFPRTAATYTSSTGTIVVPPGALESWYAYRNTRGTVRGDVVCIGDSTMYGSGGLYALTQRLRDRAVGWGMADGGKGMFAGGEGISGSPIAYDAPEINGFVSSNFAGFPDQFDVTDGQFYYDTGTVAGHTLTLQFRGTCARLWYVQRADAGDFTYSVDGGSAVTVHANGSIKPKFIYLSGLTANTTHTVLITNLATGGGTACYIALAPMNSAGVVFQKYATSGDTINSRFFGQLASAPYTQTWDSQRVQPAFGLTPTAVTAASGYRGAAIDATQPSGGAVNPVLAVSNLGFNDLTVAAAGDTGMWTEYVKRFAGVCADAGCPGIICTGQMPYNAQWPTYGAARWQTLKDQALASGLVFVDLFYPIGGPSLSYSGGTGQPHLTKSEYQAQADYLWDSLLGLAA